ncbi:DNA binding protein [Aureococcus anophagefferens]|nr:DNA binding protein [Aureococcus anophagefferens]
MRSSVVALLVGRAAASTTVSSMTNTYALGSSECYAPTSEGGWGYCGAPTCKNQYITCSDEGGGPPTVDGVTGAYRSDYSSDGSDCTSFLDMSDYTEETDWAFKGACTSDCTQRTDGVCDGTFLEQVIQGPSIKYAFCNDKWLLVLSSGEGGVFEPHLNNVPSPPLGTSDGVTYCTGDPTRTIDRYYSLQYPLDVVDFSSGVYTNNVDLFDGTSGSDAITYAYSDGTGIGTYGLPDGAGVGITVNGMQNWVTQNNRGEWNQPTCEASPCNLHVGQGAGQPHVHGDLFSDSHQCLYGTSNYTSTATHPPIIGFGADGHLIYGRYLGDDAPGFAAPLLDECSGHTHDDYLTGNDMNYACCSMTDYYVITGNEFNNMASFFDSASTCTVAAQPDNGAYASDYCETGDTLYSGNGCHVTCDSGYAASGITRCVEGAFVEYATCVADATPSGIPTPAPTDLPAPVPTPAPTHPPTVALGSPTKQPVTGAPSLTPSTAAPVSVPPPTAAPVVPPTPAPSAAADVVAGEMTVEGMTYEDASDNEAVFVAAVADAAAVSADAVAVAIASARRRRLTDTLTISYTITVASESAATALAADLGALDTSDFDAAIQTAAASAGVSSTFSTAATTSAPAPSTGKMSPSGTVTPDDDGTVDAASAAAAAIWAAGAAAVGLLL